MSRIYRRRAISKRAKGATLTELVVATILLSVILAALGEIMVTCTYASIKLSSLVDVRISARVALERIKRDVKSSHTIRTDSTSSHLVLLRPTYYFDPRNNPASAEYDSSIEWNPLNGTPEGVGETVEYFVERDPIKTSEFFLKYKTGAMSDAQIISTGIVGPFDVEDEDGLPDVFTFLQREVRDDHSQLTETIAGMSSQGVAIELEVIKPQSDSSGAPVSDKLASNLGIRGEAFTRFNRGSRVNYAPSL